MSWLMEVLNEWFQTLMLTGWVMKFVMFRVVTDHAQSALHHALDWLLCQVLWRAFRQHRLFTPLLSCLCLTSLITSLKLWLIMNSTVHFAGFGWTEYTSCTLCREQCQRRDVIYTQVSPGKRAKTSWLWRATQYRLILRKEHTAWFLCFAFYFTACMFADVSMISVCDVCWWFAWACCNLPCMCNDVSLCLPLPSPLSIPLLCPAAGLLESLPTLCVLVFSPNASLIYTIHS